jgi:DGQHR domain-containing protein
MPATKEAQPQHVPDNDKPLQHSDNTRPIKIPALLVRQGQYRLFVTALPITFFSRHNEKLKVDIFQADTKEGYQRRPTEYRVKDFARYLVVAKGMSPTAVLLNIRDQGIEFEPIRKGEDFGYLHVPMEIALWIVDGQHRIKGFQEIMETYYDQMADLGSFKVPVVIMQEGTQYDEAKQFLITNKTQKGVKPDLAERFIATMAKTESAQSLANLPRETTRDIDWRPKATEIVDLMNGTDTTEFMGNPWYQKIQLPNEPKGKTLVSQKSFEDSLKPVLTSNVLSGYSTRELATILVRYWKAIVALCPVAFELPKDHVIQKTSGVHVFHRVLPRVVSLAGRNGRLTQESLEAVLKHLDEGITEAYWSSNGTAGVVGSSKKSIAILVSQLTEALEDTDLEIAASKPYEL